MRTIKEASLRKNEILDVSAKLFAEKGFDHTSINDILEVVGIAKGTLYHHFKSKQDIMDALIERQTSSILSAAQKVAADKSIPVVERMIRTVLALHIEDGQDTEGKEMIEHLHKPENALMQQKTKRIILQGVSPILATIVEDGVNENLFHTPYPLECMEMVLMYMTTVLDDDVFELTLQQRSQKIESFIFHLERLLGVEQGQLTFIKQMFGQEEGKK